MRTTFIKSLLILMFIAISFQTRIMAQNTVGLKSYNPYKSFEGYNLIYPHNQSNTYLLNNCGEIVQTWEGPSDTRPGNTAYLLEDGRMLCTRRPANVTNDAIWAGGGGATIELKDWDNNIEWSYTLNDSLRRLHHDIAVINKPNGNFNILAIAWEKKTKVEATAAGRDTTLYQTDEIWPDYILEIDPLTDQIVWEWHTWDHLIQDIDPNKANYGVISENPQLMDINYDYTGTGKADWMHTNAIDYDPINDQILLSIPNFNEIWIIDHTTTTSQAASHSGGLSGIGGDIMFRWGSPSNYGQGDENAQKLFFQHDAHYINNFIESFDPNYGKIALFNNQVGENYSTVNIINPGFDMYEWNFPIQNNIYLPYGFDKTEKHPIDSTLMHSTGLSSVQYLPNSNLLICVGRTGYSFEMTPDREIVWEYVTPIKAGNFVSQGDTLVISDNLTFRMFRYPVDYSAFEGKDLSSKGWLEIEPNETFCDQILATESPIDNTNLSIFPNPATDMITIEWDNDMYIEIAIYNMQGQQIINPIKINGGRKYINTSNLLPGAYFIMVNGKKSRNFIKI